METLSKTWSSFLLPPNQEGKEARLQILLLLQVLNKQVAQLQ